MKLKHNILENEEIKPTLNFFGASYVYGFG
jgi:hypothetical protein